ncbi:Hint domain-containing protein [Seohaeicola saemankumensis]|uniref:Hint domain-containing protein n=1 Tax=Seohaeicola saemankumensis TaxID=481181 RepID=A0ABW3TDH2_9RHOB
MTDFFARVDSTSANNPALNLTGEPAVAITFLAETPAGGLGDLLLEQDPTGGADADTQVSINGVSYSFTVDFFGTLPIRSNDGANQVPEQFRGEDVLRITVQDYPAPGATTHLSFMPSLQATQAEMDAFGNGRISVQNLSFDFESIPVCFAEGTRLLTPRGAIAVEDLRRGDLLQTLDSDFQPIIWVSNSSHQWPGSDDKHKPVLIARGALGGGVPIADLTVSPQHKIYFDCTEALERFGTTQVLAPAIGLTKLPKVRQKAGVKSVTYFHVLLPRHAIILANGAYCESFYPGRSALSMLSWRQKAELFRLFPKLRESPETGYGDMVRPSLTKREAETMCQALRDSHALGEGSSLGSGMGRASL